MMNTINLLIQFVKRKNREIIKNPFNHHQQIQKSPKNQHTNNTKLAPIQDPSSKMQPTVSNYIQLDTHNRILQSLRERELQYKTRIIQLQKQNEYEVNRANEFQQKFKQALLHSGDEVSLIEKLSQKQNENNQLRVELIRLKKSFDKTQRNGKSNTSQLVKTNKQLIAQNEQLANTINQLKNAAISAIMAKDDQIEQLNQKINKAKQLQVMYQNLLQKQQILEKQIEKIRTQAEQEQKLLSQKLSKQRQRYLQKLQEFQNNLLNQQSHKQQLIQKAQILQNNLQNKQQIIYLYQNKLNEYDTAFRQQKQNFQQDKLKLSIEIDNLKDKLTLYEKEIHNMEVIIAQCNFKEKETKIFTQRLKDENAQLERKLTIKKRKNNPKMKSSDIYSSFQGISQKSSFYSSFYKQNETVKASDLGQIEELEENDVLDSFIDLEKREVEDNHLQQEEEEDDNQINYMKQQEGRVLEVEAKKNQSPLIEAEQQQKQIIEHSDEQSHQPHNQPQQLQQPTQVPTLTQPQPKHSPDQLSAIQQTLSRCQQQIKTLKYQNEQLKKKLDESYTQIQRLTKEIFAKTIEIQNERQTLAQLRSQNKKSQSEKELIVELENFKQHVFKLENALLIEKLQCAEKEEFMKERGERQRKNYQDKIMKLEEQVKNLSPKKKKGFFR